ncbi:MAG: hypothetical protein K0S61_558 [Anaerocolumna sp.]|nr:hypothetical protein [Anaerocolumna sp.]
MNSINNVVIPSIANEDLFEDFCMDYWKKRLNDKNAQRNGRRGQRQDGVDIFGRTESKDWVGIQCKVKSKGDRLTEKECEEEISKALTFNPKLSEYYILTTAPRDATLQKYIRGKDDEHIKKSQFRVCVMFWDDIEQALVTEDYQYLYYKYYRDHCIRSEYFGNGISKLMSLEVGVGSCIDTNYEILLGKLPVSKKGEDLYNINYWKNSYIIVNLNDRKSETFKIPCHESDFEGAITSRRDRYIISEWINKIGDKIDDVIYGIEEYDSFAITEKEYIAYLKIYRDDNEIEEDE